VTGQDPVGGMTLMDLITFDLIPAAQNTSGGGGAGAALPSSTLGKVSQEDRKAWKVGGFILQIQSDNLSAAAKVLTPVKTNIISVKQKKKVSLEPRGFSALAKVHSFECNLYTTEL